MNPPASPNPMVYDATDKLVNWPGMMSFTYHPTGSLKEQKNTGGTVQKTWAYTGAELILSVTHAGVASPSAMEWDGDANRISFTSSTAPTTPWHFIYDTAAGIPAVIEEQTPSGSVYYIREPGGQLIARVDGATTNYYHFDALGSTRFLSNGSGTVTDTYTYDAWGKQIASTGSTAQPYRYVGRLGYYSHYQDSNLFDQSGYQFLQLGVRLYDPLTGRFTQADPIQDGLNWYVYAYGNPMQVIDPSGLSGVWSCGKPEWWMKICGKRGKYYWCRRCEVKCAENCQEERDGQGCLDQEYNDCMEACKKAGVSCKTGKKWEFRAVW